MSRVQFHRPVRVLPPEPPREKLVIPSLPQVPGTGGSSATLTLMLPLLSSLGIAAYMFIYRQPLLMALGVTFVIVSVVATSMVRHQMRAEQRRTRIRQQARYLRYLREVREQVRLVAGAQRLAAAWVHPSPARLLALVRRRRRVWERRPEDADFLVVRVGHGRGPLSAPPQLAGRTDPLADYDPEAQDAVEALLQRYRTVGHQPAQVDLRAAGVLSVVGEPDAATAVAGSLICQVAVLHAPLDVGVVVLAARGNGWEWAKWLPHTAEPDTVGAAGVVPLVATDLADLEDVLTAVTARAEAEHAAARRSYAAAPAGRRTVVVLDRYDPAADWARTPVVTGLLEAAGPHTGLTVVCVVGAERQEPTRTRLSVRVEGRTLTLHGAEELRGAVTEAVADLPAEGLCELIARGLAPLSLTDEPEQVLVRTTALPDLLGIADLDRIDPAHTWVAPSSDAVLRVPIGVAGDGEAVLLDLKESARGGMGPHGLIVGATGSGKSELLRTLVTGLAVAHPPELLSMVLLDFKGGATFAGVTPLPHVAGMITNLADDLSLLDRVRTALVSEQQRRQRLLRDAGNVDNVHDYQLRRAAGQRAADGTALPPLPYLLILVDEFSELLTARPDFIDVFVQLGRVGRSLGMHLLLASQRLEEGRLRGLESHLSYRICLRTFSAAESRAVIGTADAYHLPSVPGSAYIKVDESVYQRLRVAHASGPYVAPAERAAGADSAPVVAFGLRRAPAAGGHHGGPAGSSGDGRAATVGGPTQLHVAVSRLSGYGELVHQVWLPPLPSLLTLDQIIGPAQLDPDRGWQSTPATGNGTLVVPYGVLDLPAMQQQVPLVFDFAGAHGHVAVVGAPQTGKSTLLRTLVHSAVHTHTPREAQFYCLDFGGGALASLAGAPHVGGVAVRGEHDLARRLLADVRRLVDERELLFRQLGLDSVETFRERRAAGTLPVPGTAADVFLVLDNWGGIRAEFEGADQVLADIAARGLNVGVHVVLTAARWMDMRTQLRDSIPARIELRLNDPTESELGRHVSRTLRDAPPGRGAVPGGACFQVALPRLDGLERTEGLGAAQAETLAKVRESWHGPVAPPVRVLPARITVAELPAVGPAAPGVAVGFGERDLETVLLDLDGTDRHLLVYGDSRSGKSAFLRTWLTGLAGAYTARQVRVMLVDYRRSLLDTVPAEHLGAYAGDARTAQFYLDALRGELDRRLPPAGLSARELRERNWWRGPEMYVVVDDYDLATTPGRPSPLAALADYLPQAPEIGLHVVLARRVAGASRSLADPLFGRVRELGCQTLILSGDPREGALVESHRAAAQPPGRGLLVRRSAGAELIQVAWTDPPGDD